MMQNFVLNYFKKTNIRMKLKNSRKLLVYFRNIYANQEKSCITQSKQDLSKLKAGKTEETLNESFASFQKNNLNLKF